MQSQHVRKCRARSSRKDGEAGARVGRGALSLAPGTQKVVSVTTIFADLRRKGGGSCRTWWVAAVNEAMEKVQAVAAPSRRRCTAVASGRACRTACCKPPQVIYAAAGAARRGSSRMFATPRQLGPKNCAASRPPFLLPRGPARGGEVAGVGDRRWCEKRRSDTHGCYNSAEGARARSQCRRGAMISAVRGGVGPRPSLGWNGRRSSAGCTSWLHE